MLRTLTRRLLLAAVTLLVVLTAIFLAIRILPGDPATAALGSYASAEAVAALRERLGLNQPLWVQYVRFVVGLVRGDLGRSLISDVPIAPQIGTAIPYTLELTVASLLIGALIGIPVGIWSAKRFDSRWDGLVRIVALAGLTVPDFVVSILLLLLFALHLRWFPAGGMVMGATLGVRLQYLTLPGLSLGLIMAAFLMRSTRASVIEVLGEQFVTTARSKGLPERRVIYRHVLRNALIPVLTVTGIYVSVLIGGTVLVETVFNRPGLGKLLVGAILQRDYNLVQSGLVVFAALVILINFLVDVLYEILDPRLSHGR